MIKEIEIENFRGIAKGRVSGLKPLTALVGANNSGKSAILEALYIGGAKGNLRAVFDVVHMRGWVGLETARNIAYRNGGSCTIGVTEASHQYEFQFVIKPSAFGRYDLADDPGLESERLYIARQPETVPGMKGLAIDLKGKGSSSVTNLAVEGAAFIGLDIMREKEALENLYSKATGAGSTVRENLIALAKALRATTTDLQILAVEGRPLLYTLDARSAAPLYLAGGGLRRLLYIASHLAVANGGIVLIEEPECFQHPKAMDEFVKLIWAAVAQGTQVVFSTHSLELLAKVFEKQDGRDLSKACLMRTRLADGQLITGAISGEEASERLEDVGEDLRQ